MKRSWVPSGSKSHRSIRTDDTNSAVMLGQATTYEGMGIVRYVCLDMHCIHMYARDTCMHCNNFQDTWGQHLFDSQPLHSLQRL